MQPQLAKNQSLTLRARVILVRSRPGQCVMEMRFILPISQRTQEDWKLVWLLTLILICNCLMDTRFAWQDFHASMKKERKIFEGWKFFSVAMILLHQYQKRSEFLT